MKLVNNCFNCLFVYRPLDSYPCKECICTGKSETLKYWKPIKHKEPYADYVYEIVKNECKDLDSVYEDYIVNLVGEYGLKSLIENNLVESCGFLNNCQLYVLLDKKGD